MPVKMQVIMCAFSINSGVILFFFIGEFYVLMKRIINWQNILYWTNLDIRKRIMYRTSPILNMSSILGTKVVSSSTLSIFAITGPRGEPMATPLIWIKISLLNEKCTFLVYKVKSFFISDFVNTVVISWSSKIRFRIISMVYSNETEVKRDFTSNDTMLQFWGTFSFLILTTRSFVLFTVYLERVKGDKSWSKYFTSW